MWTMRAYGIPSWLCCRLMSSSAISWKYSGTAMLTLRSVGTWTRPASAKPPTLFTPPDTPGASISPLCSWSELTPHVVTLQTIAHYHDVRFQVDSSLMHQLKHGFILNAIYGVAQSALPRVWIRARQIIAIQADGYYLLHFRQNEITKIKSQLASAFLSLHLHCCSAQAKWHCIIYNYY